MYAKLICDPPLGRTTVVPGGAKPVIFTVILETNQLSEKPWEVALWSDIYNVGYGKEWATHMFEESTQTSSLVSNCHWLIFGGAKFLTDVCWRESR